MRIVLVNWARPWNGAGEGGGVNGYAQSLALELVRRGHDVAWLSGGVTYVPGAVPGEPGPCTVRRHRDWLGVRVFEVVNSPVLAPSICQFGDPLGEVSAPELESHVRRLFVRLRPDVVHFHNLEGFSAGCVRAACEPEGDWPGARVVFSLHNYHTICPQVYLLRNDRTPCFDSDGGRNCATCVAAMDRDEERRRRLAAAAEKAGDGAPAPPPVVEAPERVVAAGTPGLRRWLRDVRAAVAGAGPANGAAPASPPPAPLPARPAETDEQVNQPLPVIGEESRGRSPRLINPTPALVDFDFESEEWRPVDNDPLPEPACAGPPNAYGRRRAAMVAMLNGCDRVLAVSEFVRRKFEAMGVDSGRLRTVHIGSRMPALAARSRELLLEPAPFDPPRPVRMIFMGYNNRAKGLPVLADSLELLTPEYLGRIHLTVYALNGHSIWQRFRRLEPRLAGLFFRPGYEFDDIPLLVGDKDLGLVPSVWWDNGPQTVMEFFACGVPVLAANLGGIPDFVVDGVNGMLFRGNDRFDLARRLVAILRNPSVLLEWRRRVRPPKGMGEHAEEMERLYLECVSSRPAPATV